MKFINGEKYYSLSEVAELMERTKATILRWHEYDIYQLLPQYIRIGKNNARYYKATDMEKFEEFKKYTQYGDMKEISDRYNGNSKRDDIL